MTATGHEHCDASIWWPRQPTLLRDIHPYGFVIEGVLVGIESTEGRVAL